MNNFLAIDPGVKGGVAYFHRPSTLPALHVFKDMGDAILFLRRSQAKAAYIEKVHASPQMGVSSAFTFGGNYEGWKWALIALGIPFKEIPPQVWQKGLVSTNIQGPERKQAIKKLAQEEFPQIKNITNAVADALMLGHWVLKSYPCDGTI